MNLGRLEGIIFGFLGDYVVTLAAPKLRFTETDRVKKTTDFAPIQCDGKATITLRHLQCGALLALLIGLLCANAPRVLAEEGGKERVASLLTEGAPSVVASASTSSEMLPLPKLTDLVRTLKASVVNIAVEGGSSEDSASKDRPENEAPRASSGSGFIVHEDGYIVTSNHVIEKSKLITVRLPDDRTDYTAEILGQDSKTDIALIKIKAPHKLPAVYVGDSDALEVGEWVVAIGNQFQLGQTVTAGIVSAKSRRVPAGGGGPYDAFIQTDASINPGSSGGPLFNTRGQVVGINTAIFSPGRSQFGGTGFNIGIGFAIPINMAREVLVQLKNEGRVRRGLLGVLIQKIDADVAAVLGLRSSEGALVADVMPGTPAAKAGLLRKDVITSFNGAAVKDHEDLPLMVARTAIGSTVPVQVTRNGQIVELRVTVSEMQDVAAQESKRTQPDAAGLTVESVSEELAAELSLTSPYGVRVLAVEAGSVAEKAGIIKDDVIEEAAGKRFRNGSAWGEFMKEELRADAKEERLILVLVKRKQGTRYIVLKRTPAPPAKETATAQPGAISKGSR